MVATDPTMSTRTGVRLKKVLSSAQRSPSSAPSETFQRISDFAVDPNKVDITVVERWRRIGAIRFDDASVA